MYIYIVHHVSSSAYLAPEHALRSDDFLKDVLSDMRVDSTEWVVQQVDVCLLVDSPRQTHSLLLTSTQVDTLWWKEAGRENEGG